jgi:HSP20 family protein
MMSVRDLIPWGRHNGDQLPSFFREGDRDPFLSLHREVNRLFDDAFRSFDTRLPAFGRISSTRAGWPSVEISDNEREIKVTAEVPGLVEKDVEVFLSEGVLTLKGEKRSETEDKEKQFSERFYGRFERRIPVGFEVEGDKVSAQFKNGVLTVTLPKTEKAQAQVKRIEVKT